MWTSFVSSEFLMDTAGWVGQKREYSGGLCQEAGNGLGRMESGDRGDWAGIQDVLPVPSLECGGVA